MASGPFPEFRKKNISRDTKLGSGRELTKRNLFSAPALRELESHRSSRFKPGRRRTSPDLESGQAFLDRDFFTMSHTLDFHSGKMVDRSILCVEMRDLPRMVSTGESPLGKRGVGICFSRRESGL